MDEIITLVKDTNSLEEVKQIFLKLSEKKQENFYKKQHSVNRNIISLWTLFTIIFLFLFVPFYITAFISLYIIKYVFKIDNKIISYIYNVLTYPVKSVRNAISFIITYYLVAPYWLSGEFPDILLLAPWIILYYKYNTERV